VQKLMSIPSANITSHVHLLSISFRCDLYLIDSIETAGGKVLSESVECVVVFWCCGRFCKGAGAIGHWPFNQPKLHHAFTCFVKFVEVHFVIKKVIIVTGIDF